MSSQPPVRIGDAEREAAARELGEHFTAGRLGTAEYEQRLDAAWSARTAEDLAPLFHDLPREQPTVVAPKPPTSAFPIPQPAPVPRGELDPDAPYGRDPVTGQPYSDRLKVVAALLQLFLPCGVGRFYSGHSGIGLAQLVLAFTGIGIVWSFVDGIAMLAGEPTDAHGRPLRP